PRHPIFDDDRPSDLSEDNELVDSFARPGTPPIHARKPPKGPLAEPIRAYKSSLKNKFPEGWNPPRKLSREAMDLVRELHRNDPETFTTPILAGRFRVSPEAIRRILKSKYEPSETRKRELWAKEKTSRALARLQKKEQEDKDFQAVSEIQDRILSELNLKRDKPIGADH
ncbi:hypothetical protein DL96DRAFT_1597946, partial [Flagelloscypha sp. PMI_526]